MNNDLTTVSFELDQEHRAKKDTKGANQKSQSDNNKTSILVPIFYIATFVFIALVVLQASKA